VTSFPGPGVFVERDSDRLTMSLSIVVGRYPQGLVEAFGALRVESIRAFAGSCTASRMPT
jgi:hypothetical protein